MTPQREADRLLALVRDARACLADGLPLPDELRPIVEWARAYRPPDRLCTCGRIPHNTHRGAAQHAAYEILVQGRSGKLRVYACRQARALHVGR